MVKKESSYAEMLGRISSDIRYCAILDQKGKIKEDYMRKKGVDGRKYASLFASLQ